MKKYVICHEEECLFICKTRADAEEIILSLAEESVYENWYLDNCADMWGNTSYSAPFKYIFRNGKNCRKMISAWAWALYSFSSAYWIDEVEELE